jgi:hypothetical protein
LQRAYSSPPGGIGDQGADRNVEDDVVQHKAVLAHQPQRRALRSGGNLGVGLVRLADAVFQALRCGDRRRAQPAV